MGHGCGDGKGSGQSGSEVLPVHLGRGVLGRRLRPPDCHPSDPPDPDPATPVAYR
jgi:hypothetical protein